MLAQSLGLCLLLSVLLLSSCEELLPPASTPERPPITTERIQRSDTASTTSTNRRSSGTTSRPSTYDLPSETTTPRTTTRSTVREGPYALSEVDRPPLFSITCRNERDPEGCSYRLLRQYFDQKVRYPSTAAYQRIESVQYVLFYLDRYGRVADEDVRILTAEGPACASCAQAAVSAVRAMPAWHPAYVDNTAVSVRLVLPVRFDIR